MLARWHIYLALFILFLAYLAIQSRALLFGPTLSLAYPDTFVVSEKTVTIEGKATPLSKVFINNQEGVVDLKGNFVFPFSLRKGVNELEIKARNRFGKEKVRVITVIVKEP